ncbi:MAG TPA: MFS transporter [Bacillus bacterium]|uniref:MFS transporter n=1 Tax=Siminovitchia fordii TaxID=254759 RepID=A0ABQ4K5V4_9BACI|nr:MFS transporter [Siminovitchia fordii]GIN21026.1 MFS transporter [Siminovitchia fordii]HBZ11123.1 MFS transporter [Bacillus sp. (in: firmicutes)]
MEQRKKMLIYAIVSILITICISGFGRMAYGILMPYMRDSLHLSYQQAGMLGTTTAIGYLVMVLIVGIMASKWGSKPLIVISLMILAGGCMVLFFVENYITSLIGMIMLGVGTAFGYTPLVNIVVGWFPNNRGLMIGLLLGGMGLGTLIASILAPPFNLWFFNDGWRYLWLLFGLVSIITTLIAVRVLKDPPVPARQNGNKDESLFKEVYFHKGVLLVAVIYGLIGFAYLIPQSFFFSYILEAGINENNAGTVMALGGGMSIFSGPVWGAVSDKIGRKLSLCITIFLGGFAILIPILIPVYSGFIISQTLWGFTFVGMLSLIQALSTEQIHQSFAPIALGYVTIYFAGGQILGPGLGGLLADKLGGISAALWLCVVLLAMALLLSTRLNRPEKEEFDEAVSEITSR